MIVRDGAGAVVFTGDIAFGGSKTLSVSPPVRVQATDGSATVTVDGEDRGALGTAAPRAPARSSSADPAVRVTRGCDTRLTGYRDVEWAVDRR